MPVAETLSIKIKPASNVDLPVVHDLILAVGLSDRRASITATFEGSTYWIAWNGNRPVGTIGLEHGDGASLLRSAAVLPEFRGHGVGRALTRSALAHAVLRGDGAVYLFSSEAGGYWQKFDFTRVPVSDVEAVLPGCPQVRSGQQRGWIQGETAWCLPLVQPEGVAC